MANDQEKTTKLLQQHAPLLDILAEALMNNEVESALVGMKEAHAGQKIDGAMRNAREAVGRSMAALLVEPLLSTIQNDSTLVDAVSVLSRHTTGIIEHYKELSHLRHRLVQDDVLRALNPDAAFLNRLRNDHLQEKKLIAAEAARRYFGDSQFCCFIQASTLAVELGKQIAISGSDGVLIHTNSVALPITILPTRRNGISVYTNCGPDYDDVCAGWLFPPRDTVTKAKLAELFHRDSDPLRTAFITPYQFTLDGQIHFESSHSSVFANTLVENSERIVLLIVGNRIVQPGASNMPPQAGSVKLPEVTNDKSIELIVCGPTGDGTSREAAVEMLNSRNYVVHWQLRADDTDEWQSYGKTAIDSG